MTEWITLEQCLKLNNYKFPLVVLWKPIGYGETEPRIVVFDAHNGSGEYYVKKGYEEAALDKDYLDRSAKAPNFKLYNIKRFCQCDYRQVILVTGCRCGLERLE